MAKDLDNKSQLELLRSIYIRAGWILFWVFLTFIVVWNNI